MYPFQNLFLTLPILSFNFESDLLWFERIAIGDPVVLSIFHHTLRTHSYCHSFRQTRTDVNFFRRSNGIGGLFLSSEGSSSSKNPLASGIWPRHSTRELWAMKLLSIHFFLYILVNDEILTMIVGHRQEDCSQKKVFYNSRIRLSQILLSTECGFFLSRLTIPFFRV